MPDVIPPLPENQAALKVKDSSVSVKIPKELKEELKKETGSLWKKILWWVFGILGVVGSIIGIVCLLKKKGPLSAAEEVIKTSKSEIAKSDIEAKIKLAEAKKVEDDVITKLKEIKEEKNEIKALEELNKLLGP